MSFKQQHLQQMKALVAASIDDLEFVRTCHKSEIADMVAKKKRFVSAGLKSVVDNYNDSIREEYKRLDAVRDKIAKLVDLQKAIKTELVAAKPGKKADGWQDNVMEGDTSVNYFHIASDPEYPIPVAIEAEEPAASIPAVWPFPTKFREFRDATDEYTVSPDTTLRFEEPNSFYVQGNVRTLELRPSDIMDGLERRVTFNPDGTANIPKFGVQIIGGQPETSKPTNPKDAIGSNKLPLHLWPATASAMGCLGFLNGMLKYGRANFRVHGIRASIYIDAAKRHLDAWFEGEEADPDDGVPHLAAALACIGIIVDALAAGKLNDDRQVQGGYRALVDDLTPHVARLKTLHAAKNPKHYTIADNAAV